MGTWIEKIGGWVKETREGNLYKKCTKRKTVQQNENSKRK